jgi:hypothetical protein
MNDGQFCKNSSKTKTISNIIIKRNREVRKVNKKGKMSVVEVFKRVDYVQICFVENI